MVTFVSGIFATKVIGEKCRDTYEEDQDECDMIYGWLSRSMYSLFRVTVLDLGPTLFVFKHTPVLVFFFLAFNYVTSFGLLNIVVGVIVEQTHKQTEENNEKLARLKEEQQKQEIALLKGIIEEADSDCNGILSEDEFVEICQRKDVQQILADVDIPVSRKTLAVRLFEVLDVDSKGVMDVDYFVNRTV